VFGVRVSVRSGADVWGLMPYILTSLRSCPVADDLLLLRLLSENAEPEDRHQYSL